MVSVGFQLAPGFVLKGQDQAIHTATDIGHDADRAAAALAGCKRLTIDARQARAVLVGLLMAQRYELDVALSRDGAPDALLGAECVELVPGVTAWLEDEQADMPPGIRLNTSGTTGKAKTASYSLDRLGAVVRQHVGIAKVVWLLTYEPASFAGIQVLMTAAVNGATVLAPERTIAALAAATRSGVTHVSATPSFWRALLAAIPADVQVPLKVATLGGEASTQDLLDALALRFPGAAIRHIYASTEAGVGFTVADGREGFLADWLEQGVEGVQLRVRDEELEIRSARGMLGYQGGAASPVEDGWLRTGDLVEVSGDRVLFQGRRDAVVNIGGTKVLPEKIEALLCGVRGVTDIAVTAHPNPILGHILVAQVSASPGMDQATVEAALKAQAAASLPPLARPARYRFVDSVVLASGKKGRKHVSS